MSREILFKAKRENWRELPKEEWWVEGSLCHVFQEDKQAPICGVHRDVYYVIQTNAQMYVVAPETVCQYTGLTNENGRKIFEGDIIAFTDTYSTDSGRAEGNCIGKVVWDEEEMCFHVTERLSAESWEVLQECYVIGNIFDNPELLEE